MVSSESEVLPATFAVPTESPAGEQQDGETDVFTQFDVDSLLQARASRPSCDDGWLDTDHYFDQERWREIQRELRGENTHVIIRPYDFMNFILVRHIV